jgi:hypothetical protein
MVCDHPRYYSSCGSGTHWLIQQKQVEKVMSC